MHVCRSKQGFFSFMVPYRAHLSQAILKVIPMEWLLHEPSSEKKK